MQVYMIKLLGGLCLSMPFVFCPPMGDREVQVTKVIDGDTIIVNGTNRIRLLGVDAPELAQKSHDGVAIGEKSWLFLKERLLGQRVMLSLSKRGYYGRWLGVVTLEGVNQNIELLREGQAVAYGKRFRFWELEAIKKAKGIWGTQGFYNPGYYRRKTTKRY